MSVQKKKRETHPVTVHLTDDQHRLVQMKSVMTGLSMSELVRRMLDESMKSPDDIAMVKAMKKYRQA